MLVADGCGLGGVLEVLEPRAALEEELTRLAHREFGPVFGDHVHGAEGLAYRSGMCQPFGGPDGRPRETLGAAVVFVDDGTEPVHHPMLDVHRARSSRMDHALQAGHVVGLSDLPGQLQHSHEHGGDELRVSDAVSLNELQHCLGVEPAHQDRRRTHPVHGHRVVDPRCVVQRRGRQIDARRCHRVSLRKCLLQNALRPRTGAVGRQGPPHRLGSAGGARRVEHLGAVGVGRRGNGGGDGVLVGPPSGKVASDCDADVDTVGDALREIHHRRVDEHRP